MLTALQDPWLSRYLIREPRRLAHPLSRSLSSPGRSYEARADVRDLVQRLLASEGLFVFEDPEVVVALLPGRTALCIPARRATARAPARRGKRLHDSEALTGAAAFFVVSSARLSWWKDFQSGASAAPFGARVAPFGARAAPFGARVAPFGGE